jgi:PTS system mannose-specific IIA component
MITGIVVTHGGLGEELLKTARKVFGDFPDCYAITNASKSPQVVYEEISSVMDEVGGPAVVFVDFSGGSCSHTCLRLEMSRNDISVISGVNLPMLLAFLNKREEVPFEALAKVVLERSLNSIKILDHSKL